MLNLSVVWRSLTLCLFLASNPADVLAKPQKWKAPDGTTFSAEASDLIGPFAIFGGPGVVGRRIPLHFLSPEDCIRFSDALAVGAEPASDWSKSSASVALDMREAEHLKEGKLVPFARAGRREPLLYVVFYARSSVGESWGFVSGVVGRYQELQQAYPGEFEFVMAGVGHRRMDQIKMVADQKLPFLAIDPPALSNTYVLSRIAGEPPLAVLLTRDGSVLRAARTDEERAKLLDDLAELLRFSRTNDPRGWKDRLHYHTIVQKHRFAKGATGPLLVGDPFDHGKLKELGATSFSVTLQVKADGSVGTSVLSPDSKVPEALAPQISGALRQAVFVPAVKDGVFVDADYTYRFGEAAKTAQ